VTEILFGQFASKQRNRDPKVPSLTPDGNLPNFHSRGSRTRMQPLPSEDEVKLLPASLKKRGQTMPPFKTLSLLTR
jgi:hypothetical protein